MLVVPQMRRDSGTAPRILLLVPWLAMGGADKFNLDLLTQLTQRGWHACVATTFGPGPLIWSSLQIASWVISCCRICEALKSVNTPSDFSPCRSRW